MLERLCPKKKSVYGHGCGRCPDKDTPDCLHNVDVNRPDTDYFRRHGCEATGLSPDPSPVHFTSTPRVRSSDGS